MGLEPIRYKAHAPQTCLSASSSILAFDEPYYIINTTKNLVFEKNFIHYYCKITIMFEKNKKLCYYNFALMTHKKKNIHTKDGYKKVVEIINKT